MDLWRVAQGFLLLLQLNLCLNHDQKVVLERHIWPGADSATICTNSTDNFIAILTCDIRVHNGEAPCRLFYVHGNNFENDCGSRAELTEQNRTVYLQLRDLTPEDSGLYECTCIRDGTLTIQLNITVKEPVPANERGQTTDSYDWTSPVTAISSSISALVVVSAVVVGLICNRSGCRRRSRPAALEGEETDFYAALQEPSHDLYQTIAMKQSPRHCQI